MDKAQGKLQQGSVNSGTLDSLKAACLTRRVNIYNSMLTPEEEGLKFDHMLLVTLFLSMSGIIVYI